MKIMVIVGLIWLAASAAAQDFESQVVTKVSRHGDWVVRCEQRDEEPESCVMNLSVVDQNSGTELVQANFAKQGDDTQMSLILPLGIYLPTGVKLDIKEHKAFGYPISFCSRDGCFVNEVITQETVDLLRKKETATLTVAPTRQQTVELPFSLTGFLDAYKKL